MRNAYSIFVRESERRKLLQTTGHKWENVIQVDSTSVGREGMAGFSWLKTGTNGGVLQTWQWTLQFRKRRGGGGGERERNF
jgi:hypothetical protein